MLSDWLKNFVVIIKIIFLLVWNKREKRNFSWNKLRRPVFFTLFLRVHYLWTMDLTMIFCKKTKMMTSKRGFFTFGWKERKMIGWMNHHHWLIEWMDGLQIWLDTFNLLLLYFVVYYIWMIHIASFHFISFNQNLNEWNKT